MTLKCGFNFFNPHGHLGTAAMPIFDKHLAIVQDLLRYEAEYLAPHAPEKLLPVYLITNWESFN